MTGAATLHFPITKTAMQPDGSLIVAGPVTNDAKDLHGQRVSAPWAAKKLAQYFSDFGAPLRVEHDFDLPPAGKGLDLTIDKKSGVAFMRARVAQKDAVEGVRSGRLRDFSLGMMDVPVFADPSAPNGRIGDPDSDDGYVQEVSLVGIGSAQGGKGCTFTITKRANKSAPIEAPGLVDDRLSRAIRREAKQADKSAAKEKSMSKKAEKAAADAVEKAAMPDGHVECPSCEGGKIKGELDCPKCSGKGHVPAEKAKKSKAAKAAATKDADSDVSDALDDASDSSGDTSDAIGDAQQAQAADDAGEDKSAKKAAKVAAKAAKQAAADKAARKAAKAAAKATKGGGSEAVGTPGQDGKVKPGKDMPATGGMAAKAKKKGAAAPVDDDGDGGKGAFPGAAEPFGGKKKGKSSKAADVPYLAVKMHDLLCPCFATKAVKSAYGDVTPEAIDPAFFQQRLARLASGRKAAPGSIAEASQAFASSAGLVGLAPKTFADLRRAAHKGWLSANPDLPGLKPGLINPEDFRRGFVSSADSTVSHTTTVPSPDLKAPARPHDMPGADLPSTGNFAKGASTKARTFYTNASKDDHAVMMGQLHDFISTNYPGCCPIADKATPAEMTAAPEPPVGQVGGKDNATSGPVVDTSRANKAAKRTAKKAAKVTKGLKREVRQLKRTVKSMGAAPDARVAPIRSHTFARRPGSPESVAALAEAREAVELMRSRDSRDANEGLETLRKLRADGAITAKQFGQFAIADN